MAEAIYLHQRLIDEFGGAAGIRDLGLLESALARPRSGYYSSLAEQGAALLQSLLLNHCFIDGNRRIAFTLTAAFFDLNGYTLQVPAKQTETFLVKKVLDRKTEVGHIADWLGNHLRRKPHDDE